jgi:hypothetical protein
MQCRRTAWRAEAGVRNGSEENFLFPSIPSSGPQLKGYFISLRLSSCLPPPPPTRQLHPHLVARWGVQGLNVATRSGMLRGVRWPHWNVRSGRTQTESAASVSRTNRKLCVPLTHFQHWATSARNTHKPTNEAVEILLVFNNLKLDGGLK